MRLIAHSASTDSGGLVGAATAHARLRDARVAGIGYSCAYNARTRFYRPRLLPARAGNFDRAKIDHERRCNYRRLGASGLKVSELSFGSWVTYGNQLGDGPRARVHGGRVRRRRQLLRQRRGLREGPVGNDHGRGAAEARLAALVVHRVDQVLLGPARRPEREEHAQPQIPDAGDRRVARSGLGLDYVDLVFCHRADPDTPIEETVYAMHDIDRRGQGACTGERRNGAPPRSWRPGRSPTGIICTSR